MKNYIENFPYIHFKVNLKSLNNGKLPEHKTSMLRGVIARKVKKNVCHDFELNCEKCEYINNCLYSAIFESPKTLIDSLNRGGTVPHPYIIRCNERHQEYKKGDLLTFEIILFGKKAELFATNLYHVFEQFHLFKLGKYKMQFAVDNVLQILKDDKMEVFTSEFIKKPEATNFTYAIPDYQNLRIEFETPFRIQQNGNLIKEISMERFLWQVHHRIFQLGIHTDTAIERSSFKAYTSKLQFPKHTYLMKRSKWEDILRYSTNKKRYMKLGGVIGRIDLKRTEELDELLPAIMFAEKFHVGKATTFGLGQFTLWFR
ncbi:hypothetical protein CIB95_12590 [Lottiidibacillus patelloidae]|uniref:CRISPR-associated protein Cas6 C-terminal domain-containing protein n=1 Tax=Lottiidibacillus patelloidae TaxID=2670334 RepID=A0A263BRC6_9BACI|nr:CRISPR system precrRNA processing endoribonuclease RAMP protein Cas6 [Lottiidibacillus patelloidae]OZM56255.1 hypothetical protein CIB95_12590 [Lottiidibacillus patelloidae]